MTQSGCSDKLAAPTPEAEMTAVTRETAPPATETSRFEPFVQTAASGLSASWIAYGATLTDLRLPDGTPVLVHLGEPQDYAGDHPHIGSLVGPVANRIAGAQFEIDGIVHAVTSDETGHALHSGPDGFGHVVWETTREGDEIVFRHTAPAGDQGYPGHLDVAVRTELKAQALQVSFVAFTDAPTPVNLTQHGYWHPGGVGSGAVDGLILRSPAVRYTAVDETLIPTGESPSVEDTPFDFRQPRRIGSEPMDVNLLVPGEGLREMATLSDGVNTITVLSDYPGLQIYTGEALGGVDGLAARAGLALEPQYPPDAVNRPVDGHDTVLRPGEIYRHTIIYRFDGPAFGAILPEPGE